jgi:hypothetical protein
MHAGKTTNPTPATSSQVPALPPIHFYAHHHTLWQAIWYITSQSSHQRHEEYKSQISAEEANMWDRESLPFVLALCVQRDTTSEKGRWDFCICFSSQPCRSIFRQPQDLAGPGQIFGTLRQSYYQPSLRRWLSSNCRCNWHGAEVRELTWDSEVFVSRKSRARRKGNTLLREKYARNTYITTRSRWICKPCMMTLWPSIDTQSTGCRQGLPCRSCIKYCTTSDRGGEIQ